ncbi:DUF2971 domain-containing protein [Pseudoalteromonas luteoviolacea]|uniref:DUF2971 domain-containing protein n=1 Tax=Pseudoalteromonas luteoviolacea DSM 6061 TaxID=1365250 RepID=A0A166VI00_9GAMM|nr:DUF2971 domain-containing protein [Pseudoalteromonas luteoviolacea]KZN32897.1 hypothetical protein N475_20470 [Pseudoalteromonas luteoviolacea DSM 6061]MBE0385387.1 hypothetical protein [Pseudoalteromonas luteoviolacea DSM 6061]
MEKVYKYFGNDVINLVFAREGFCGLKCSLPKDYNDPYELFLGMDLNTPTEQLAFYKDVVGGIPQNPTTCFSKSPIVSPMWAHYANNHSGFVLEFDLVGLQNYYDGNPIWEVSYRKEPHENLRKILEKAAVLLKPRYTFDLNKFVFVESYFSKYDEWSYEQECRFVDMNNVTEQIDNNSILFIPLEFVTSIIIGHNCPQELIDFSLELAEDANMEWYQLSIGKSHPKPYLKNGHEEVFIFTSDNIEKATNTCNSCAEPLTENTTLCPWCGITEAHEEIAAQNNPFRMLDSMGLLDEYMTAMNKVDK